MMNCITRKFFIKDLLCSPLVGKSVSSQSNSNWAAGLNKLKHQFFPWAGLSPSKQHLKQ